MFGIGKLVASGLKLLALEAVAAYYRWREDVRHEQWRRDIFGANSSTRDWEKAQDEWRRWS